PTEANPSAALRKPPPQQKTKLGAPSPCRPTPRTPAPGANAAATIACFCSLLHRRRRSGPASTSTLATAPVSCTGANTGVCTGSYQPDQITNRKAVLGGRLPLRRISKMTNPPDESTTVAAILAKSPSLGLMIPEDTSFQHWLAVGKHLALADNALAWRIGDWWIYGEHRYGERIAIFRRGGWSGPGFGACRNYATVAR